jgi:plastocyanin
MTNAPGIRIALPVTLLAAALALTPTPAALAADHRVGQAGKKFDPSELSIRSGDTITFVNDDGTIHNLHSETPGHEFEIKRQSPKQVNTLPFTKPGTFVVECRYHGQMKLTVNVTP